MTTKPDRRTDLTRLGTIVNETAQTPLKHHKKKVVYRDRRRAEVNKV